MEYKDRVNSFIYEIGKNLINGKKYDVSMMSVEQINDIKIYLYMIILVCNNEKYKSSDTSLHSCTKALSKLKFITNDAGYVAGNNNRKIVKSIRDSFVHGSGNIKVNNDKFIILNSPRPGSLKNKITEVSINVDDFINILEEVSKCIDSTNDIITECFDMIERLDNNQMIDKKEWGYILLLAEVFSFNKESVYDKYMKFISSSVDFSKLEISNTKLLDDSSVRGIKMFCEDHKLIFKSIEDTLRYYKELLLMARKGYFIEKTKSTDNVVWDSSLMALDEEYGIHIPNGVVLEHIRNAVSHGLFSFDDNGIKLNDYNKKDGSYFFIEMSYEELKRLIFDNYFQEGIGMAVDVHEKMDERMYGTQIVDSILSFENFFAMYREHFPEKGELEVLDYMLDNYKISTYLYENPDRKREFLRFVLPESGKFVYDYICGKYGYNDANEVLLRAPKIAMESYERGLYGLGDYLKGNDNSYIFSLLIYYKNRYSFEDLDTIKSSISEEEIENLDKNTRLATLYQFLSHDLFNSSIYGNYLNDANELDRILCAIVYNVEEMLELDDITEKEKIKFDEYLDYASESNRLEEAYHYYDKNRLAFKVAFLKNKLRLRIINLFNINNTDIIDKLLIRSKLDNIVLFEFSLIYNAEKRKEVAKDEGKIR